jgi:signal transduction histidine kinase
MKTALRWWTKGPRPLNLWLLLILFLGIGGCLVAMNFFYGFQMVNARLVSVCDVAHTAYANGGPQQLAAVTGAVENAMSIRVHLLDGSGSQRLTPARERLMNPFAPPHEPRVVGRSADRACLVTFDPLRRRSHSGLAVAARMLLGPSIWIVPFLLLLSGALAWYITWRMRRIETAITSFGSGALGVRMGPDTGDPIGRLSRSFNEMAERIESLVIAHRRLCIEISHELRSPLARLRLAVGLARSNDGALDRIEVEASRLHSLVDDLLNVARAEMDPGAVQREPVDIQELMTCIADDCAIECKERGCSFDLAFHRAGCVNGDPELLRRAVENIVRNAVRHSPIGSIIDLQAVRDGSSVLISIRDRGPGVPECSLDLIFQPFYRVEGSKACTTESAGMGLAIAQRVIVLHGGAVKAANTGPGLRVDIRLPREVTTDAKGAGVLPPAPYQTYRFDSRAS